MKRTLITTLVCSACLAAEADFTESFQAARKDFTDGRFAVAVEAFMALADTAPGKHRVSAWCLSYAARALEHDDRYDQAMTVALSIDPASMAAYTQMEIMTAARKYAELAESFAGETNMRSWPDQINYKCFFMRGVARTVRGEREAAAEDFRQCADLSGSDTQVQLDALGRLASLQQDLGLPEQAKATYNNAFTVFDRKPGLKGMWLYPRVVLGAARAYMARENYDEAEATLRRFEVDVDTGKRNTWDFQVLEAYGDIAAARGKRDKALALYREAVVIDTHEGYVKRVEGKIEELED